MSRDKEPPVDESAAAFLRDLTDLFAEALGHPGELAVLQHTLDAAIRAVDGRRGFLALVDRRTGELCICYVSGDGWTEEARRLRLSLAQEEDRGITGHVALTGRPYFTGDVSNDPHYIPFFDDVRSELAVPILSAQGQTRGVINIDMHEADAFDTAACARVAALAQAAAASLVLAGFRARERALYEIGNELATTLEEKLLVEKVVDVAADALDYEDCSVFLLDDPTNRLVLKASRGGLAEQVSSVSYAIGEGLTGWVAANAQPIRVAEPRDDPRWLGLHTELPIEEIGAFLAVPIVGREKVLGVLRTLRRKGQQPWFSVLFTETDERILGTIARQLGAAIENARAWQRLLRAERMAAWGELSARSAHMIGNRAFALKGDLNELGYLMQSLPPDEARAELEALATSMGRGIERLEEILRDFRDFVMATQVAPGECDINVILHEVADEVFPKRSPVRLEMELAEGLSAVRCDAAKLKRALSELVENAVSFQPEGGIVQIVSRAPTPEDRAKWRLPSDAYVALEFADAGPGVPTEQKERIFQPFFTSRVKGMGLGLSIVKGIVEAHRGQIHEVGEPGQGARFVIFLPTG